MEGAQKWRRAERFPAAAVTADEENTKKIWFPFSAPLRSSRCRVPEGRRVWGQGRRRCGGREVSVSLFPQRGLLVCGPRGQGQQLSVAKSRICHWGRPRILLQVFGNLEDLASHQIPGGECHQNRAPRLTLYSCPP